MITACNIGNPQQLKQKPITFFRQVAALVEYPDLLKESSLGKFPTLFPADAIARATEVIAAVGGSVGAYTTSQGIPLVRQRVAEFIQERDGYPANPDDIYLTAGASPGVQAVLNTVIADENTGIMIPTPQYPLYSASIAMSGGKAVPYYLNESADWDMSTQELERALSEARASGISVKALCVINPGNPTGQCLSEESMKSAVEFCSREKLVLLADEVYQSNIYQMDRPFISFKKVLKSMSADYENFELISFHSVSKGMIGECGRRGGYFECVGIDKDIKGLLYKVASVSLCPPVAGQLMVENMVNPPKPGSPSYELYKKEYDEIFGISNLNLESLKRRAQKLAKAFNSLQGVTCNEAQGAMYLFPQISLNTKVSTAAKAANMKSDEFYAMALLEATGVVKAI